LEPDLAGGDDDRQGGGLKHADDHRARAAEQSHAHDRREPAGEVDREQEQWYPRHGGRAREQRVQVEAQAARDEEHRDEYAERDGLKLHPELGMGRLVAIISDSRTPAAISRFV
jgi:hypothetical protein